MYYLNKDDLTRKQLAFLRTKFICIIWTYSDKPKTGCCSWGLSLFVLFEQKKERIISKTRSWGLSLFVLFELTEKKHSNTTVLEGWIYLYYLNFQLWRSINWFYFMCTSWSFRIAMLFLVISWLNLFLVNFILFSWLPYTK